MQLRFPLLVASIACAALAPAAFSTTWIVDQANGPGTNFTDLPPAIAAAAAGDVLIVRPGYYSAFLLEKGLTILGESPTTTHAVPGMSRIRSVPAGEIAVVAGLSFAQSFGAIDVSFCFGTVVLDRVSTYGAISIHQCADVRLSSLTNYDGVWVNYSRVEFVSSNLEGAWGGCCEGDDGLEALNITGTSRVLFARSSAHGGDGGIGTPYYPGDGGAGGSGVKLTGFGELLIAGGGVSTIEGGAGGLPGTFGASYGPCGWGVYNWGSRDWRSGATIVTGCGSPGVFFFPVPGAFDTAVTPDDPTLELVGIPNPGAIVELNTYSIPGSIVRMTLGGAPVVIPVPGVRVEQLTTRDRSVFLGVVPASGKITHLLKVPSNYPIGAKLFAQSRVTDPSFGEVRRTNSVAIIVR